MCLLHPAETSTADDFCQSETFQPRCLAGETVIITKAVYGRMSHSSRCLQEEEVLPALRDDPRHMGCFENVLQLVSKRCSGQPDCEIRIPDPEMEKTSPCYRYTVKYLEAHYQCIRSKSYTVTVIFMLKSRGWMGRSGTVGGRSPDASFAFYLTEAFQSQTNTEKILYNKSR